MNFRVVTIVMALNYLPPILKNFGKDFDGYISSSKSVQWQRTHHGLFVLSALENTIQVGAVAAACTHNSVCNECDLQGRMLGGGCIDVNDEKTNFGLYGCSGTFGSLPNKVLIAYFSSFDYGVEAKMYEQRIRDSTIEWFKQHGIDI